MDIGETIMPFGKYRGKRVEDIPRSYMEYFLEQEEFEDNNPELAEAFEYVLEVRTRSYINF